MKPIGLGTLTFACTFVSFVLGVWLSAALPEHHFSKESKETVKLGIGLLATITALVLGLVTATAKSSFDDLNGTLKETAAEILTLDRTLARYGPETKEVRDSLKRALANGLRTNWPQESI